MIRSIKALGLALLAIAAFGAFAAASAQAVPGEVHITTTEKAVITGDGTNHELTIGTQSVKCTTGQFEGTVQNGVNGWQQDGKQLTGKHIIVTPTYENCQYVQLAAKAEVKMNGCQYTLEGTAELTSQAKVVGCTTGKQIEIIAAGGLCTITIGEQAALKHVTFTNDAESQTTKHHLQDHETVTGIVYTRDGAFCPQGEASYHGTTTIKAYKDLGNQLVTRTGHQSNKHNCGEEVGILGT
jgi:hypothetical protein